MPDALLIALIAVAALACPAMTLLGRRGIGRGCKLPGCGDEREALADLRMRQRALADRIERLERSAAPPAG